MIPYAVATREMWTRYPTAQQNYWLPTNDGRKGRQVSEETPAPEYDPQTETRDAYLRRMGVYMEQQEAAAAAAGGATRPRRDPRAWQWLVAHVVKGTSYAKIWTTDPTLTRKSRNVVREACVNLAKLIELPLAKNPAQK